jgi:catechol 2,3-dioxygenase-like lactoylglutathione lyase family enzyme
VYRATPTARRLLIGLHLAAACLLLLTRQAATAAPPKGTAPSAHFHHIHLNVIDPKATIAFYKKFFGAEDVRYRGLSDGLFSEKSFILLSQVTTPAPNGLGTSLWHIGWAGVDGPSEFAWRNQEGIGVQTPVTRFGSNYYMYFWGPDHEIIEIWTASKNHRFEHVHLFSTDLSSTLSWFQANLGLGPQLSAPLKVSGVDTNYIPADNVSISVMQVPARGEPRPAWWPAEVGDALAKTDGTVIDHIAFSYLDIKPVFKRMKSAGVKIVHPIATSAEYGLTSFFVRGPDGLLIEIVEEAPVPEGVWQRK